MLISDRLGGACWRMFFDRLVGYFNTFKTTQMILSALLFLAAVICYSISQLQLFGKLKWMDNEDGFWGIYSWKRKYKIAWSADDKGFLKAPDTWYYRFFKIPYRERFTLSATLLVFLTDGFHLMQFFFKLLFCAAFYPLTNWWFPFVLWLLWTIVWNLCDKYLTK